MIVKKFDLTDRPGSEGSLAWGEGGLEYEAFIQSIRKSLHIKAEEDEIYKVSMTWSLKSKGREHRFLKLDLDNAAKPILDAIFNSGTGGKRDSTNRDGRVVELRLKKIPSHKEYLWIAIQTLSRKGN
ncbi:MAG: RusA family crossover junction endodeoxyribonuclease [candidate division Zixibacteria bacterium]|nr:RusA family crossover junction endodeoxyribonuclease [candidate division Zixibacteria bacterium]